MSGYVAESEFNLREAIETLEHHKYLLSQFELEGQAHIYVGDRKDNVYGTEYNDQSENKDNASQYWVKRSKTL